MAILGSAEILSADTELSIFDAHIHFNDDARSFLTPQSVLRIMDGAGVSRALVSSTPNDGTLALIQKYPDRIVPMLRPYRAGADRGAWYRDAAMVEYVERELQRGVYRGIGEFHLHSGQTGTDEIRRIVQISVRRNLILHAHSDEGAIRELFAIDPGARILWAHAGMSAEPETVGALLDRHRTLWVELSLRNGEIAPAGRLDPAWRGLFLRHPDRFMIGTDTWAPQRWDELPDEMASARRWLAQLPRGVAEQIAHDNAKRLFPP
jgi:predicted TIM-barrel fold metal-dependent hydrolase